MEIKTPQQKRFNRGLILSFLIILLIYVFVFSPQARSKGIENSEYSCDAETREGEIFKGPKHNYANGQCQSDLKAKSGKYSCRCASDNKYGMTFKSEQIASGDTVLYSVWVYNDNAFGRLVFSSEENKIYKAVSSKNKKSGTWKQLKDTLIIPDFFKAAPSLVYPSYETGDGEVFFDDLKITVLKSATGLPANMYQGANIEIQLTSENLAAIERKKKEAIEKGLLFTSREDLVDADLKIDGTHYNARIRLKGDLLDHLRGDKYSFRIELNGNDTWRGMNVFSVHNSKSRSHLAEWYMHLLFKQENILTPDYDFVTVSLNGNELGVYAYEQHFDNALLDKNKRPIGPILRHTDDAYWNNVQENFSPFHWTDSSQIELFNKENDSNPEFMRLYDVGQSMLRDFIHGRKQAEDIFDLDRMAKYYALMEIGHATHAQLFTNIRFYLNPLEGKLEPIAYDCFGDVLPAVNADWTAMGEGFNRKGDFLKDMASGNDYMSLLFRDDHFYRSYMTYLEKYSSEEYLNEAKIKFQKEGERRAAFIRTDTEYSDYRNAWDRIFRKAEFTRKKIIPKKDYSLVVYTRNNDKSQLQLHGHHHFPLEILGYINNEDTIAIKDTLLIEAYHPGIPVDMINLNLPTTADAVVYSTLGTKRIVTQEIPRINAPIEDIQLATQSFDDLQSRDYISVDTGTIRFKTGSYTIDKTIVLPKGYEIKIESGTYIKLKPDVALISYSPLFVIGSSAEPVIIEGLGNSNNGIYIGETDKQSYFINCIFKSIGQLAYRNLSSPGAITCYKSKAKFESVRFINIPAPDVIHVVMSNCDLYNTNVVKCRGDFVDAYFSELHIQNLNLNRVGKDGLEIEGGRLSGSELKSTYGLRNTIRALNKAKVNLKDLIVEESESVLYAGTQTDVYLNNVIANKVKRAFELHGEPQSSTSVKVNNYRGTEVQQLYLMPDKVDLTINGAKQKPN